MHYFSDQLHVKITRQICPRHKAKVTKKKHIQFYKSSERGHRKMTGQNVFLLSNSN